MHDAKGNSAMDSRKAEVEQETGDQITTSKVVDVLVIVTGGTLSMVHTEMGYMTDKGLYKRLR